MHYLKEPGRFENTLKRHFILTDAGLSAVDRLVDLMKYPFTVNPDVAARIGGIGFVDPDIEARFKNLCHGLKESSPTFAKQLLDFKIFQENQYVGFERIDSDAALKSLFKHFDLELTAKGRTSIILDSDDHFISRLSELFIIGHETKIKHKKSTSRVAELKKQIALAQAELDEIFGE